jgi:hypothetical protein
MPEDHPTYVQEHYGPYITYWDCNVDCIAEYDVVVKEYNKKYHEWCKDKQLQQEFASRTLAETEADEVEMHTQLNAEYEACCLYKQMRRVEGDTASTDGWSEVSDPFEVLPEEEEDLEEDSKPAAHDHVDPKVEKSESKTASESPPGDHEVEEICPPAATWNAKNDDEECCVLGQHKIQASVNTVENITPDVSPKVYCIIKFAISLGMKKGKWQYQVLNALCDCGSSGTLI